MSERALEESGIPAERCRITVEDALSRLSGTEGGEAGHKLSGRE
jgi:hypothetical protein